MSTGSASDPIAPSFSLRLNTQARTFGTTPEGLLALLALQGNSCPVCTEPLDVEVFQVDHCHLTGQVRGLLHGKCNRAIGMLGDDPERCERASRYLRAVPPEMPTRVRSEYARIEEYEPERGPGRPAIGDPINVRFPANTLAQIDRAAAEAGVSRAEKIRQLLSAEFTRRDATQEARIVTSAATGRAG